MRNFKIIIQYDGSRYLGWQRQKSSELTIQGKIEQVLTRFQGAPVEIIGSGRTDAGVHAYGQVANFYLDTEKSAEEIKEYLNHYLPDDIGVIAIEEVQERFHSRFLAKDKIYRYRIINGKMPQVFERKYVYTIEEPLDLESMKMALQLFLGTHDFRAFTSMKKSKKTTVRTIYEIKMEVIERSEDTNEIDFYFQGDGFLYNMVRIMMGTLIEIGQGKRNMLSIEQLFEDAKREDAGYLAPGKGLALMEVRY